MFTYRSREVGRLYNVKETVSVIKGDPPSNYNNARFTRNHKWKKNRNIKNLHEKSLLITLTVPLSIKN